MGAGVLAIEGGVPVRDRPLDHRRGAALLADAEREAVAAVVARKALFRYGEGAGEVAGFEAEAARLLGVPHALATSSGTAALVAGLAALGVGPGDEVVVPAATFVATANAVVDAGAVPVYCDVDDTLGMDPAHLATLVGPRTAAVVPVHLENVACDVDGVLRVAQGHGVPVLEDACQAMGATYRGRALGTFGALGAYSLQAEKNITCGEGGLLVATDETLFARAARYGDQGGQFTTGRGGARGDSALEPFVGQNLRMGELAGAVARVQVGRLPAILAAMRVGKRTLRQAIGPREGLRERALHDPEGDGGSSITWYLPDAALARRFTAAVMAEGAPCVQAYGGEPVYANPALRDRRAVAASRSPWAAHPAPPADPSGFCPVAEDLLARSATLLVGASWGAEEHQAAAEAVAKVADALLGSG